MRRIPPALAAAAEGRFDAVVAPADFDLAGIDAARILLVDEDGNASIAA